MDIVTRINWVDILVVIIMFRISYVALQDGLSHEIFPLIGAVGTALIALRYYTKLANLIYQGGVSLPIEILSFLCFLALLTAAGFLFKMIRVILDKIIKISWHPLLEKFGGFVCGVLRGAVVVSTVLILLALMPLSYLQWSIRDKSLVGIYFVRVVPAIYEKISGVLPDLKIESSKVSSDAMVKTLVSDKSIAPSHK